MTMLVSLDQAKAHLRVDHDLDDTDIELKIMAASEAIVNHLKEAAEAFVDSSGEVIEDSSGSTVPAVVQQATLLLLGYFYRDREPTATDTVPSQYGYGYLPRAVVALLYSMRDPTLR